ncbi:Uncharacterised protein [Mycobacterium tuberculosis]|nr:Uncharacterised protein [Mycobacterium tuberculosis]
MLHLQAGVHFEEVEVALAIDDEFHRAGGEVTNGFRKRDGLFTHGLAGRLIQER